MFRRQNIMPSRIPLIAAFVCALLFFATPAHAAPPYAEILVDPATGAVLHAVNADALTQPASLTKMMTLFLAFDALDKGELALDQTIPVSRRAQNMAPSKLGLVAGTTVRVEDAILGLVTLVGQRCSGRAGRGARRDRRAVRRDDDDQGPHPWHAQHQFPQRVRSAEHPPDHDRSRHRHAVAGADQGTCASLSVFQPHQLHLQRRSGSDPQPPDDPVRRHGRHQDRFRR